MFSHLWASAPSPSRSPLAGSVVGAAVSTGGRRGLRGKGGAGGSSCLGRGPHIASMPRAGPSRSTSRESRCIAGPGASSPPFRVLVFTEAGDSQNDLPKVMAQILGTGGVSLGTQPGSLLQGPDEQRLVKEEAPAGLRGARGEGRRGSRELDVREAANPGPGLPREASFSFPLGEGSKRPQPRPSTEPRHKQQLQPLAPVAHASGKGSCIPCGVWVPLLSKPRGGRSGGGAWRGVKGNRPLAPFSARSLRLVRSSHRDQDTEVCTHSHTHSNRTRAHTLHSDLVLKHTRVSWVKICTAGVRPGPLPGAGPPALSTPSPSVR